MEKTGILRVDECDVRISPNKEMSFSREQYKAILEAAAVLNNANIKCIVIGFSFDFLLYEEEAKHP